MLCAFLERMAAEPFGPANTCVLVVADWIVLKGHADPAAPYRGRVRTTLGWKRLVRREGGLEALMTAGAARSGLIETLSPAEGDVGLIRQSGLEIAAICLGGLWAAKGRGLVVAPADTVLKAWSV